MTAIEIERQSDGNRFWLAIATAMVLVILAGFGMAAYMIENPAEAVDPDSDRVQGAGLESGLRWFEAYRRRGQAHGAPILDELIELRRQGGRAALQAYHRDHQRCGRHVGEPLPGE